MAKLKRKKDSIKIISQKDAYNVITEPLLKTPKVKTIQNIVNVDDEDAYYKTPPVDELKREKKPFIDAINSEWYYYMICPHCDCRLRQEKNWIYCSKPSCGYFEDKILLDSIVKKFYNQVKAIGCNYGLPNSGRIDIRW